MSWEVNWTEDAENELATLWMNSDMRAPVTQAAQRIDERLEREGDNEGESRGENRRITFEPPGVTFIVDKTQRRITVTHIWAFET